MERSVTHAKEQSKKICLAGILLNPPSSPFGSVEAATAGERKAYADACILCESTLTMASVDETKVGERAVASASASAGTVTASESRGDGCGESRRECKWEQC